jgi:hypothetical protein
MTLRTSPATDEEFEKIKKELLGWLFTFGFYPKQHIGFEAAA